MKTKTQQIKDLIESGDEQGAIIIAARFPVLGVYKTDILRAREAYLRPRNYKEMGYDIEDLKYVGAMALRSLLGIL